MYDDKFATSHNLIVVSLNDGKPAKAIRDSSRDSERELFRGNRREAGGVTRSSSNQSCQGSNLHKHRDSNGHFRIDEKGREVLEVHERLVNERYQDSNKETRDPKDDPIASIVLRNSEKLASSELFEEIADESLQAIFLNNLLSLSMK